MDPNLLTSETGKILVRDNAIVVSVEHVRVIVTADMVIIPQDGFEHNKLNQAFNSLLQEHIIEHAQVLQSLVCLCCGHLSWQCFVEAELTLACQSGCVTTA